MAPSEWWGAGTGAGVGWQRASSASRVTMKAIEPVSRDCVIVRLRRFVHGKSATRENAVVEEPPARSSFGDEGEIFPETNKFFDSLSGSLRRGPRHVLIRSTGAGRRCRGGASLSRRRRRRGVSSTAWWRRRGRGGAFPRLAFAKSSSEPSC